MGRFLSRLHAALLALMGKDSLLRGQHDPLATVQGVFDALESNAVKRGETQAIHHIREARKTVVREALKPFPPAA